MFYDLISLSVSTFYLLRVTPNPLRMSGLVKLMFYDGLMYFVALTAANIVNLILYRASDPEVQSSGASLAFAVTWIMSQRILIHLRDAAEELHGEPTVQTITGGLTSAGEISRAIREQFGRDQKAEGTGLDDEYALGLVSSKPAPLHPGGGGPIRPEEHSSGPMAGTSGKEEFFVGVQRSVTVGYGRDPHTLEGESYRTPRRAWESRSS